MVSTEPSLWCEQSPTNLISCRITLAGASTSSSESWKQHWSGRSEIWRTVSVKLWKCQKAHRQASSRISAMKFWIISQEMVHRCIKLNVRQMMKSFVLKNLKSQLTWSVYEAQMSSQRTWQSHINYCVKQKKALKLSLNEPLPLLKRRRWNPLIARQNFPSRPKRESLGRIAETAMTWRCWERSEGTWSVSRGDTQRSSCT